MIAGTRLTVELIWEKGAADESIGQIFAAHRLTHQALLAVFAFSARTQCVIPAGKTLNNMGACEFRLIRTESAFIPVIVRAAVIPIPLILLKTAHQPKSTHAVIFHTYESFDILLTHAGLTDVL